MVQRRQTAHQLQEWVFRHCRPNHIDLHATFEASRTSPELARSNIRGEFGAIYAATTIETALAELDAQAARIGLTRAELLPRVMLTLGLQVERVLDLSDATVRDAWGLTPDDLRSNDYTKCQEIARAARDAAQEAILYPSARGPDENFAVFLDRLGPGSFLKMDAPPREIPPTGTTLPASPT